MVQLSKDVVPSELLDDLKRLLDLEAMGVAVFDNMYQFARKLFAEDTMRFAVEVVRVGSHIHTYMHIGRLPPIPTRHRNTQDHSNSRTTHR